MANYNRRLLTKDCGLAYRATKFLAKQGREASVASDVCGGFEGCSASSQVPCGGCDMMGIDTAVQVQMRVKALEEAFARAFAKCSIPCILPPVKIVAGETAGYRCRVQLDGGAFHARHSNERIFVKHCPVATDEVNEYLGAQEPHKEGRVQVFGDRRMIGGNGKKVVIGALDGSFSPREDCIAAVLLDTDSGGFEGCSASSQVPFGKREIRFDVRAFFQSNMGMLERALPLVCGGLEGENVLDMYAGCGTFSAFLADKVSHLTLVEKDALSITFAEANMAGRAHKSFALSGAKWVKFHGGETHFDAVVIDPPRSGMEKEVRQWIIDSGVPIVRSLSCDAVTHARDAAELVKGGYALQSLMLLDFYPQTHRIESLAEFRKQ